jgi:hypothetical protein
MLEDLKDILRDDNLHIFLGKIERLHLSKDRSNLRVEVEVWPDQRVIICDMTWDMVGPEAGFYSFPTEGDLVLCASAEGDVEYSYVIKRLSSSEDKIPANAEGGNTVLKALNTKKLWLTSDTRINLSKGDSEPSENLVLGQIFKTFASSLISIMTGLIDDMKAEEHIGNLGFKTGTPINAPAYDAAKSALNALKASPIDDSAILSNIAYTEKGD